MNLLQNVLRLLSKKENQMRINVIPVSLLLDQHLRAEFREIIMSIHFYKKSLASPKGIDKTKISSKYTLNQGHAYMWYNKFGYIKKRYFELLDEMKLRGFKTDEIESKFIPLFDEVIPLEIQNDYTPTQEDIQINLDRIKEKIKLRPNWYKFYSETITEM